MKDEEIYTWKEFDIDCRKIAKKLEENNYKYHFIYGVPRGGMIVAVKLSHLTQIPLTTDERIADIIVDEICDTGKTFKNIKENKSVYKKRIFICIHKKQSKFTPDIWLRETDKWVAYPWEK